MIGSNEHPHASAMVEMQERFAAAKPARRADLVGTWVAVKEVWTEKFLTGRTGPDHVASDENGIRRPNAPLKSTIGRPQTAVPGRPLEWRLTFRRHEDGMEAESEVPWVPTGDVAQVAFGPNGDFRFEKQYGGDGRWIYRCRAVDPKNGSCVFSLTTRAMESSFAR